MPGATRNLASALLMGMAIALRAGLAEGSETWMPARWRDGALELQRRAQYKTLPSDPALRESIRQWYDPVILGLLQGTPINSLLVTWGIGADSEKKQTAPKARKVVCGGSADLGWIDVRGLPIKGAVFDFKSRRTQWPPEAG